MLHLSLLLLRIQEPPRHPLNVGPPLPGNATTKFLISAGLRKAELTPLAIHENGLASAADVESGVYHCKDQGRKLGQPVEEATGKKGPVWTAVLC